MGGFYFDIFNILKGLNVVPFYVEKMWHTSHIFKKKEGHILKYATWRAQRDHSSITSVKRWVGGVRK